jgi:hypothetical protein
MSKRLKPIDKAPDRGESYTFDVSNFEAFSIVLISKCARVHPVRMLKDHGFEKLTYIGGVYLSEYFTADEKEKTFPDSSGFGTDVICTVVSDIINGGFPCLNHPEFNETGLGSSNLVCLPKVSDLQKLKFSVANTE